MSMSDPIADLLTRIRNGQMAKHEIVVIPASKMKVELLKILQDEGYIESFEKKEEGPQGELHVELRYLHTGEGAITTLERVSKPGRRVYRGKGDIPKVLNGLGINIFSTSRGVMTGGRCAREGIGGEVLCNVW